MHCTPFFYNLLLLWCQGVPWRCLCHGLNTVLLAVEGDKQWSCIPSQRGNILMHFAGATIVVAIAIGAIATATGRTFGGNAPAHGVGSVVCGTLN